MILPIPSKNKRFIITVGITAIAPAIIGILLYDPTTAYSDYFRRKVTFSIKKGQRGYREIQIPVPVSPRRLTLEIYNKRTGDENGFKVTKFEIDKMPKAKIWASPERHRFMDFAIDFAQKAGFTKAGFYPSQNHEFLIQYLPAILDQDGVELVTPARIHKQMPRVQLSQKMFRRFTVPVRVAILSHEGCHYFMNTRSEKNADLCGLQYYLDYGFPKIEAVYAATKVFNQRPGSIGSTHVKRASDIIDFIDEYKLNEAS